jgi:hypothetical protein
LAGVRRRADRSDQSDPGLERALLTLVSLVVNVITI